MIKTVFSLNIGYDDEKYIYPVERSNNEEIDPLISHLFSRINNNDYKVAGFEIKKIIYDEKTEELFNQALYGTNILSYYNIDTCLEELSLDIVLYMNWGRVLCNGNSIIKQPNHIIDNNKETLKKIILYYLSDGLEEE